MAVISEIKFTDLPEEYEQVEYLESTGTQYIDTGVIPSNTTGFKIRLSLPEVQQDVFRFGCRQNAGDTRFVLGNTEGGIYFGWGLAIRRWEWKIQENVPFEANLNYLNSRKANMDGLNDYELSDIYTKFTYSLIMFGRNNAGNITSSAQKIYGCKISNGEQVVRDFKPCYRKSDNVAGMYDLVEQKFYTNSGTGEFAVGSVRYATKYNNETIRQIYHDGTMIKNLPAGTYHFAKENHVVDGVCENAVNEPLIDMQIQGNSIQGRLPREYQQVEYIQNDGTSTLQYIDTGVIASENNSYEAKAQLVHVNNTSQTVWGGRASATAGALQSNQLSFVKSTITYQFVSGNTAMATTAWDNNIHIFYADKNKLYVDNTLLYTATSSAITESNNVYLFATNTAGTVGFGGGSLKMYYCKIWTGDKLVRDYIPCYRIADNVVGFYDLVEQKFYTNMGTGNFVAGLNTPTPETPIEVQSVGEYDEVTEKYKIPITINETTTNIYLSEPLRKIGDYADYIDYKNKKIVRKIETMVFNGEETFNTTPLQPYPYTYYTIGKLGLVINDLCICTHLEHQADFSYTRAGNNKFRVYNSPSNNATRFGFRFYIDNVIVYTANEVKSLLAEWYNAGNPMIVYYVHAEGLETEEAIEIPEISTFDGTNVFDTGTTIKPSQITVDYWKQVGVEEIVPLDEITQDGSSIFIIKTGATITQQGSNLLIGE